MASGGYTFWLGAEDECPSRVWGEWSPTAMVKVRLCGGITFEGPAHEFNWTGERHPTTIVAVELPEFKA